MLDWLKLLKVKIESEEDASGAIRLIAETVPDNMLLNMIKKCRERGHYRLLVYLLEEKEKRYKIK